MAATAVTGAAQLVAELTAGAARVQELMPVVVTKVAADLVAEIQKRADLPSSGPPGPRNITGDYVGSWSPPQPVIETADTFSLSVGTDRPQATRLEYGFGGEGAVNTEGIDSLGRHYHQPPYPHMGPAVDVIEPVFYAAMEKVSAMALPW